MRRLIGGWMIFKGTGYMVRRYFLTFSYLPLSQWVSTFKGGMMDDLPFYVLFIQYFSHIKRIGGVINGRLCAIESCLQIFFKRVWNMRRPDQQASS